MSVASREMGGAGGGPAPPPASPVHMLTLNNIEVIYDGVILVLKGVSLTVREGGITTLLGANGAGKTTTLKAISNLLRAERGEITKGTITLAGEDVSALGTDELVRRGVVQVMEGRHCFEHLTVEENLLTGAFTRADGRAAIERDLAMVYGYFPRLAERRRTRAGYASGGEQQMTAIGRALMARPEVILLDEPSMGLAPQLVEPVVTDADAIVLDGHGFAIAGRGGGQQLGNGQDAFQVGHGLFSGRNGATAGRTRPWH